MSVSMFFVECFSMKLAFVSSMEHFRHVPN